MVMHVEPLEEIDLADEKQLTGDAITAVICRNVFSLYANHLGHLAAEQQCGKGHTRQHAQGQVVRSGEHRDRKGHQHHSGIALRDATDGT